MAGAVVDSALETIRDLLVEEVKFLCGVSKQVKQVQVELQRMQCFLEDVDKRKCEEQSIKNFVKEIRDLSYDIEDVVETYAAEAMLSRRKMGIENILHRVACLPCECLGIHEVGSEINTIKEKMANLTNSMETYGIEAVLERGESDGKRESRKRLRETYAHGKEHFVGMENDIRALVKILLNDDRKYRVVSLYGMGGSGKTTFAKELYNHRDVQSGFDAFAWVCVSQDCNPKNILQDILKQLLPEKKKEIMDMEERELVPEVYKELKREKCLVVMDDIWKVDDYESLLPAFPIAEANSKILITTRIEYVAKVGFFHKLRLLSEDEGWELLQKKAFTRRDPKDLSVAPKTLEDLGRQMVKKCEYLPLAIAVLGGLLSEKDSFDSWEIVSKDVDLYLSRGTGNEGDRKIKQVLSLSYDDLPYHLKPCFLYLSRFKEDESISAEDLYLLWIAEGMISPKDQVKEETSMDVAKRYLGELASRSMVQVKVDEILAPDQFESCRLHDLLRDLCLKESAEEEFHNLMDFRGGKRPSLSPSSTNSILRRLAIYMDVNLDGISMIGESTQKLRSLFLRMPWDGSRHLPQGVIDFEDLKFLRVLNFQNLEFVMGKLPKGIGKLIHLRLVFFRGCGLAELPSCISDLPFLQTLDLRDEFGGLESLKMPNVLWRIKRLRYLYLPFYLDVPEGKVVLGVLDELEILEGFDNRSFEMTDLSKLKSLRRLRARIDGNDSLSKFIDCIEINGKRLETYVTINSSNFWSEEGRIVLRKVFMSCSIHGITIQGTSNIDKLPEYEPGFFPNLTYLRMYGGKISKDPMCTLEKLPKLRKLILGYDSFEGKELICHASRFLQLRALRLVSLQNLEKLTVAKGAMPCLSRLELSKCENFECLPEGIRFITTLQTLDIGGMPQKFKNRVAVGGEDFDKVRRVNSILTRW